MNVSISLLIFQKKSETLCLAVAQEVVLDFSLAYSLYDSISWFPGLFRVLILTLLIAP